MYKLLLTFKYLRRRLIPVFALLAVMLCTAMVIIVISVMGGFLDLLRGAGRTLMGDVSIEFGLGGFPHYAEVIAEVEKLPEAEAATPLIYTMGLIKLPGVSGLTDPILREALVLGIDGEGMDRVTGYGGTLFWTRKRLAEYEELADIYGGADPVDAAVTMKVPWKSLAKGHVPLVPGIEVNTYNYRTPEGQYEFFQPIIGDGEVVLTVVPVTQSGAIVEAKSRQVVAVNEFNSGVYEVDEKQVFIPFDVLQELMNMQEAPRIKRNEKGEQVYKDGQAVIEGTVPARASRIYVKAAEGVPVNLLRDKVQEAYERIAALHDDMPMPDPRAIATWEQRMSKFLSAVENERGLMAVLFGIISIVAVMIVGVIFYMIVLEKTRDIGVLRSIGASRGGVASIFITFAFVIGTLGAGLGFAIAWLIVTYINEIHAWLGRSFGIVIWDRSIYFFDHIPSRIDPDEAGLIVVVAIVASVIGAIIPAVKAARVDPVESLRYE